MLRYLIPAAGAGLGALVLQACTTGPQAEPEMTPEAAAALAEYTLTGETMSCLNTRRIDRIEPLDERYWLIEATGGDTYLNVVSNGCNGADSSFTYLSYQIPTGQLCRGEIVRVMDRGTDTVSGSCGLGEYQALAPAD